MKSERGDLEIQETLVSEPEHLGEFPEKPEKLEISTVFNEKREGGLRNSGNPGVRAGTFRGNPRKARKACRNQWFLMKSERGDPEIQGTLVSGPEHFREISEKPEQIEKSMVDQTIFDQVSRFYVTQCSADRLHIFFAMHFSGETNTRFFRAITNHLI